jgi:hypothetical protein
MGRGGCGKRPATHDAPFDHVPVRRLPSAFSIATVSRMLLPLPLNFATATHLPKPSRQSAPPVREGKKDAGSGRSKAIRGQGTRERW